MKRVVGTVTAEIVNRWQATGAGRDRLTRIVDRLAIGLSGLCLVHCLALPLATAALPALATALPGHRWVHVAILATALPLAFLALHRGWRRHRDTRPAVLGATGLLLLMVGIFAGENWTETAVTVLGGLVLASAHVANWRLVSRQHGDCDHPG